MKRLTKILLTAVPGCALLAAGAAVYTIRQSWPKTSGTIELANLRDEVTIHRDEYGIPHIYASNTHDLFVAQGFVHAQDRFWQMDFWRHIGSGSLAELFGESEVSRDRFLRTLGWPKVMAWDLDKHKLDLELERSQLLNTLSREQVEELFPTYPEDHPVIISEDLARNEIWSREASLSKSLSQPWERDLGRGPNLDTQDALSAGQISESEQREGSFPGDSPSVETLRHPSTLFSLSSLPSSLAKT